MTAIPCRTATATTALVLIRVPGDGQDTCLALPCKSLLILNMLTNCFRLIMTVMTRSLAVVGSYRCWFSGTPVCGPLHQEWHYG